MIPLLKSECRKLLTVRSTYVVTIIGFLLIIFVCFWVEGFKGISGSPASTLKSTALAEIVINSSLTSAIISIVAVLFVGHEYRHNMIMYTLTAANSRLKVMIAKTLVIAGYAALVTLLGIGIALGSYLIGVSLRDATLPAQQFDVLAKLSQLIYYNVSYGLIGLLLGMALRNIVGAIAFVFIVPGTVESLLALLLKDNAMYLPFTALERFIGGGMLPQGASMSIAKATVITLIYLIAGWAITAYFFVRRDAN